MIYGLLGALTVILVLGWFGFERQREVYEQMVAIVERDLDAARQEAKVYRNLLFPIMAKSEGSAAPLSGSGAGSTPAVVSARRSPAVGPMPGDQSRQSSVLDRRLPFRRRFKIALNRLNTKQQATDALASALQKQPSQEKSHV